MSVVFLTPPLTKPSEPGLSAAAAAGLLRVMGCEAYFVDASIGWHEYALSLPSVEDNLRRASPRRAGVLQRAARRVASADPPLRNPATYADRRVYTSAVRELEMALALAAEPYPGVRLAVATIGFDGRRVESRATLSWFAERPGPFDAYVCEDLLPALDHLGASKVALSLTFQQQAPAAFRMARLLSRHRPGWTRWLGGPLVACWLAAGFDLSGEPFSCFDRVVPGHAQDLEALAGGSIRGPCPAPPPAPLAPDLAAIPWSPYLAPVPIVPAATGRGCYWRRCTFCPDHLHPPHRPCDRSALETWLLEVGNRFPTGAMVHFTDSAVPPKMLDHIATVVRHHRLPIRWHGFVRVEACLAEREFAWHLARGGCAMLQLGVESGSARLLDLTGKGTDPDRIRRVLASTAEAGILNQVYLLFGLPSETDTDRERTLTLIADASGQIHAVNPALLNLPLGSPMYRNRDRVGITHTFPFGEGAGLSLYRDFSCGSSHPRSEARHWLGRRFFKHPAVRAIQRDLRTPFKANHLCFLEPPRPPQP